MVTTQQLTAINLKYSKVAKSLKSLAFGDLSAKALFFLNRPSSLSEIKKSLYNIINVRSLSDELVLNGLEELKSTGKVENRNGKWILKEETYSDIEKQIKNSDIIIDSVIKRNFPERLDPGKLKTWFIEAVSDFFTYNGDEWVNSMCKGVVSTYTTGKTIDEILLPSITKHNFLQVGDLLKDAFSGFLSSEDKNDQEYLMDTGFAMFSARLVAADVGADILTINEIKNSNLYFDTNIFYAVQLEKGRLAKSMRALEAALREIGVKLFYIHETELEYGRVWSNKRKDTLKLLELFDDEEVVLGAGDDFIKTALYRRCTSRDDFERFFTTFQFIPKKMEEGLEITKVDNQDIENLTRKAKNNSSLKNQIQNWTIKTKPTWNKQPKSNMALDHDASLISVVEEENKKGIKSYIITMDRGLQACCAERAGQNTLPTSIFLEGLIQILAANNAGPNADPANYAPLLTSILLKRCSPPKDMYVIQDLQWLYNLEKNVTKFKGPKIKRLVIEVNKARLSGKSCNDESLQRTITRMYQEELGNIEKEVESATKEMQVAREETIKEKELRLIAENKLIAKEKSENRRKFVKVTIFSFICRLIFAGLFGYIIYVLADLSIKDNSPLDIFLAFCGVIGTSYKILYLYIVDRVIEYKKI